MCDTELSKLTKATKSQTQEAFSKSKPYRHKQGKGTKVHHGKIAGTQKQNEEVF
jgi:hypothetical protein